MAIDPPATDLAQKLLDALDPMISQLETLHGRLDSIAVDDTPVNGDFAALVTEILNASADATDSLLAIQEEYQTVAGENFFPQQG